jgi:RNase P/RNase MRP subunit p30
MYINSFLEFDLKEEIFKEKLRKLYHLGYQASIVEIGTISNLSKFKTLYYPQGKSPIIMPPININMFHQYRVDSCPLTVFPRITIQPKTPDDLKRQLNELLQYKLLIAVKSSEKEILEIAARDGRVDLLVITDLNIQKTLTKGILSLVKQNNCFLDFSLLPIIELENNQRTKVMRMLYRLFLMAKPLKFMYTHGMYSNNKWLFRGPREITALLSAIFQISDFEAKKMVETNTESLVLRYIKRDQEFFLDPGVEIVDIK